MTCTSTDATLEAGPSLGGSGNVSGGSSGGTPADVISRDQVQNLWSFKNSLIFVS